MYCYAFLPWSVLGDKIDKIPKDWLNIKGSDLMLNMYEYFLSLFVSINMFRGLWIKLTMFAILYQWILHTILMSLICTILA